MPDESQIDPFLEQLCREYTTNNLIKVGWVERSETQR